MSIRIREIEGETVALCAAKTEVQEGDIYLDDNAHHALFTKFAVDFESEGYYAGPVDELVKELMLRQEYQRRFMPAFVKTVDDKRFTIKKLAELAKATE